MAAPSLTDRARAQHVLNQVDTPKAKTKRDLAKEHVANVLGGLEVSLAKAEEDGSYYFTHEGFKFHVHPETMGREAQPARLFLVVGPKSGEVEHHIGTIDDLGRYIIENEGDQT